MPSKKAPLPSGKTAPVKTPAKSAAKPAAKAAAKPAPAAQPQIDMAQLADLLAARLQAAAPKDSGASEVLNTLGASEVSVGSVGTALLDSRKPVCTPKQFPIEEELTLMSERLDVVHNLITELMADLDPVLAHADVSDSNESCAATRPSESPLHRRLLDRNETLESVIVRLRSLRARVRN